ncbi:cytochrome c oxidase subunit CcoM [Marinobacter sp. F4216]|nr:cytochrome c oxidase subunit CcoM [Marinobacter sp. F4216]
MDAVVIAGLVVVLLVVGFFGGVALFVAKDQREHGPETRTKSDHAGQRL